jgi:hypothetical protein
VAHGNALQFQSQLSFGETVAILDLDTLTQIILRHSYARSYDYAFDAIDGY